MSQDFFLQNRAHQIARLCATPAVEFPSSKIRAKLPAGLAEFYELLANISEFAGGEAHSETAQLSAKQRGQLLAFEKLIVQNRFSDDEKLKQPAVKLIRAIFADANYFSGLKPLPQYTDAFAYERLFPSWLNLLSAAMLPQRESGKPRLSGAQQGSLFEFLSQRAATATDDDQQLTGLATFIASRFESPRCEQHLQRLAELLTHQDSPLLRSLEQIELASQDAREFCGRLSSFLIVKHSSYQWPAQSSIHISSSRPPIRVLPPKLLARLAELEASGDGWATYFSLAQPLSQLVDSPQLLAGEYAALLEKEIELAPQLLRILVPAQSQPLGEASQICMARLIARQLRTDPAGGLANSETFAERMVGNLEGFSESTLSFFCRTFIEDEKYCKSLLGSCKTPDKQAHLATQLVQLASKTQDSKRFLNLLCCATVISPDANVREAKHALQALDAVVSNRSIGNKELSDLVDDLQAHAAEALGYLACPIMAGAGKTPRLAALYLTLNDITETFETTGKVGNFSVVRAKYSALTNQP